MAGIKEAGQSRQVGIIRAAESDPVQDMMNTFMSMGMLMAMMVVLPLLGKLGEWVDGPTEGYQNLLAMYWSETAGEDNIYAPGSQIAISDGARFGGRITFQHKGFAEEAEVGFWCDVDGEQVWAGPVAVAIGDDSDWKAYEVYVEGTFDKGGMSEGDWIGVVKTISGPTSGYSLEDPDAKCYVVMESVEFSLPENETEYKVGGGTWHKSTYEVPAKLPVADGSTVGFRIVFRHKGVAKTVRAVANIDIGGGSFLTFYGDWVQLGFDETEREYTQEILGTFDTGGGPVGRYLSCIRQIYDDVGNVLATNTDSQVFEQVSPGGEVPSASLDEDAFYTNRWAPGPGDWTPPADPTLALGALGYFAAKFTFKHSGPGGLVLPVLALDVAGDEQWSVALQPVELGFDEEEKVYEGETYPGTFSNYYYVDGIRIGPLVPIGHTIDGWKRVYLAEWSPSLGRYVPGALLAQNEDSDIYRAMA